MGFEKKMPKKSLMSKLGNAVATTAAVLGVAYGSAQADSWPVKKDSTFSSPYVEKITEGVYYYPLTLNDTSIVSIDDLFRDSGEINNHSIVDLKSNLSKNISEDYNPVDAVSNWYLDRAVDNGIVDVVKDSLKTMDNGRSRWLIKEGHYLLLSETISGGHIKTVLGVSLVNGAQPKPIAQIPKPVPDTTTYDTSEPIYTRPGLQDSIPRPTREEQLPSEQTKFPSMKFREPQQREPTQYVEGDLRRQVGVNFDTDGDGQVFGSLSKRLSILKNHTYGGIYVAVDGIHRNDLSDNTIVTFSNDVLIGPARYESTKTSINTHRREHDVGELGAILVKNIGKDVYANVSAGLNAASVQETKSGKKEITIRDGESILRHDIISRTLPGENSIEWGPIVRFGVGFKDVAGTVLDVGAGGFWKADHQHKTGLSFNVDYRW